MDVLKNYIIGNVKTTVVGRTFECPSYLAIKTFMQKLYIVPYNLYKL